MRRKTWILRPPIRNLCIYIFLITSLIPKFYNSFSHVDHVFSFSVDSLSLSHFYFFFLGSNLISRLDFLWSKFYLNHTKEFWIFFNIKIGNITLLVFFDSPYCFLFMLTQIVNSEVLEKIHSQNKFIYSASTIHTRIERNIMGL